jgi:hypothetical protein
MGKSLLLAALALLALSAGCQRQDAGDYLSINGKVFIFNIRMASAYYQLDLNRLAATPDNAVVTVEFENPAGGPPLVSRQKVFPKMTRIDLHSADLVCVVTGKPYKIHITLHDADGKLLQTIDTALTSTIDQSVMPAQALITGPAYDKNPEAFGKDGSIIFRQTCKAA